MLFPVFQFYTDTVFLMQMFSHLLCRIYRTVLSACASEADHQMCKTTFQITFYRSIHQCLHMLRKVVISPSSSRKRITASSRPVSALYAS